jgi:hypothetical protein
MMLSPLHSLLQSQLSHTERGPNSARHISTDRLQNRLCDQLATTQRIDCASGLVCNATYAHAKRGPESSITLLFSSMVGLISSLLIHSVLPESNRCCHDCPACHSTQLVAESC